MNSKLTKSWYGYIFIAPFFIGYLIFSFLPLLYTFALSFTNWDGFSEPTFVGLENYARLIQDPYFIQTIGNTLIIWIMSIVPQLLLALALALLINEKFIKGKHFFRAVYYFPNLVTPITLGVLFSLMFDWQSGQVNLLLMNLGLISEPINWFNSVWLSRIIVSGVIMWQYFGFNVLIFVAGLQSISSDIYEAAEIDGATKWQRTKRVTLPMIKPVLLFTLINSVIGGLQMFDIPMMLQPGPDNSTRTMVMYMYETAFQNYNYGYGAAIAVGVFIIVMIATLITMKLTKFTKQDYD